MKPAGKAENRAAGASDRVTAGRLLEKGKRVGESAQSFGDSVESLLSEAEAFVRGGLERNPYGTLAAAAGVGFVVAGGLGGRMIASIALMSGRALAAAALQGAVIRALTPDADRPNSDDKEKA